MFLALDKDMNGTLSKQELRDYADGTLTDIFIERGRTCTVASRICVFVYIHIYCIYRYICVCGEKSTEPQLTQVFILLCCLE